MDITEHLVATVLDQGHLCPLPLTSRPIHWKYDHALRLHPQPTLVVLADHTEGYNWKYTGCEAANAGSFASDGSFGVFRPAGEGGAGGVGGSSVIANTLTPSDYDAEAGTSAWEPSKIE